MYKFSADQNKAYELIINNEGIGTDELKAELSIISDTLFSETMWHLEFYGKVYNNNEHWELY